MVRQPWALAGPPGPLAAQGPPAALPAPLCLLRLQQLDQLGVYKLLRLLLCCCACGTGCSQGRRRCSHHLLAASRGERQAGVQRLPLRLRLQREQLLGAGGGHGIGWLRLQQQVLLGWRQCGDLLAGGGGEDWRGVLGG